MARLYCWMEKELLFVGIILYRRYSWSVGPPPTPNYQIIQSSDNIISHDYLDYFSEKM